MKGNEVRADSYPRVATKIDESARLEALISTFIERFPGSRPELRAVRSPLRVCPLGAHIDHQLGIVTGMTIDHPVLMVFQPLNEPRIVLESTTFPGRVQFSLDDIPSKQASDWGNYPRGAALGLKSHAMERNMKSLTRGFIGLVDSDMPVGGLSSSAAVTSAYLLALEAVNGMELSALENVEMVRFTENKYIGLNNGILDQTVILSSEEDTLTCIDCRDVNVSRIPTPSVMPRYEIVIAYCGISRQLIGTDYNTRVSECCEAAKLLLEAAKLPSDGKPKLRDVPEEVYKRFADVLPAPLSKRSRHFFGEMRRVREGMSAWADGSLEHVGKLITESGMSSIENYECGCAHMIALHEVLKNSPGVFGTRFSGAGFRGSCLALIDPARTDEICRTVHEEYTALHPEYADSYSLHLCRPDGRAGLVQL